MTDRPVPAQSIWPDFDAAMRELVPDLHPDAIVYEVDAGQPGDLSTTLSACHVVNGACDPETLRVRVISREWLAEFCARHTARSAPKPAHDQTHSLVGDSKRC